MIPLTKSKTFLNAELFYPDRTVESGYSGECAVTERGHKGFGILEMFISLDVGYMGV